MLKRYLPYLFKYKKIMIFDLFCAALTCICDLILPLILRTITNTAINDLASLTIGLVLKLGALYLVLRIIDAAAQYYMADTGHIMGVKIESDGFHEIDDDEQFFMRDYELDGDELIHNELIMGLPMKVLCKDDCKGLCPMCGSNRNEVSCGCDTFVPDPRMAAIQDIFNANNKEV